jgi:putative transposase
MIDVKHNNLSIRRQCDLMSISRSNLYYKPVVPAADESILANEIHDLWMEMSFYGYRKITAELKRRGHKINHKKVLGMMQDMKIQAIYPRPKTTINNLDYKKYPYLLHGMKIERPNQVWATDITYIKMPGGFMYLIGIIDVFSRFLISWSFSNTMEAGFCLDALNKALATGKKPEILNTDQGCQFTSKAWIDQVEVNGIKVSMDGKGRWADNIYIERFWRTIKYEHILLFGFTVVKEARESIGQFIKIYNYKRLHQSLNYQTPSEVYIYENIICLRRLCQRGFILLQLGVFVVKMLELKYLMKSDFNFN